MPDLVHDTLMNLRKIGGVEQRIAVQLEAGRKERKQGQRRFVRRLGAAILLAGALLIPNPGLWLQSLSTGQWVGLALGAILLLWP
jgi:ubiquinone biosynthesis protein